MSTLYNKISTAVGALLIITVTVSCDIFGIHDPIAPDYPCKNGVAKEKYPCKNIDLVSHLSAEELGGESLNDIWGWVDPRNQARYAIVGLNNGVSIVDITHPSSPRVMGRLPSHPKNDLDSRHTHSAQSESRKHPVKHGNSAWGDMKVYKNHLFAVSEEKGHGVHIFDLTRLRDLSPDTSRVLSVNTVYDKLSSAHNIHINTESGYAYAVGTGGKTCGSSGLHIINIKNPKAPEHAGCFGETGYIHDTQCVIYRGSDSDYHNRELCFNSNADKFSIVDVTNKQNPELIASLRYQGIEYAHQGWLTKNHRYFVLGDELDELRHPEYNRRTYILNLEDLDSPTLLSTYKADVRTIDHNLYIKNNYAYQSNYTDGITILRLDKINRGTLKRVAYFDTFPKNDGVEFKGSWGNYPFFRHGLLITSDITGGLFVLRAQLD